MKRRLRPEELRLWGAVAATVHPLQARPRAQSDEAVASEARPKAEETGKNHPLRMSAQPEPFVITPFRVGERATEHHRPGAPKHISAGEIEPGRRRRIARDPESIGARLDLHGMTQDEARDALERFVRRSWEAGFRAVLVITGKGSRSDGILRRRAPEWLASPELVPIVAGISEAHRRHGGEGAIYVALKRRPRASDAV